MKPYLLLALLLAGFSASSQKGLNTRTHFRVAFYNLENLFYPQDDSLTRDEAFTKNGIRNWSFYRYHEKSNRMAKAILSIGKWEPPEIVGVAEVENRKVLQDLIESRTLRKFDYNIVHYESPDRRGIDVAALYRKNRVKILHSHAFPVKMPDNPDYVTRDVLYLKTLMKADTFHIMYCHWPSRYGGREKSEPKRIQAALTVRKVVDSLRQAEDNPSVIIAGDLNDEWHNLSVHKYLGAKKSLQKAQKDTARLVNLMAQKKVNQGSHRFHGVWSYLDQIIVSPNLLDSKHTDIADKESQVIREKFLLEKGEKYPGVKPFRSFIGMRYHGGFSDHLPVYIDLALPEVQKSPN